MEALRGTGGRDVIDVLRQHSGSTEVIPPIFDRRHDGVDLVAGRLDVQSEALAREKQAVHTPHPTTFPNSLTAVVRRLGPCVTPTATLSGWRSLAIRAFTSSTPQSGPLTKPGNLSNCAGLLRYRHRR